MLTGDSRKAAEQTAKTLGIDQVYSELLPGDKVQKVEELLLEKEGKEKLVFVGDGINDAPVLLGRISELQWGQWDRTRQSKRQM